MTAPQKEAPPAPSKVPSKSAIRKSEEKKKRDNRGARGARQGRGGKSSDRSGDRPRGGRQFDRRSGTGRGKETAKHGGGARNWGNEKQESELVAEAEVQESAAKSGSEEEAAEEPVEEEDNEMTLDEYMSKLQSSRTGEQFAEVEIRQVSDDFSSAVKLSKDGKTPDFMEASFEKVYTKKSSGRKKNVITDVGFQAPQKQDRRSRGDYNNNRRGNGRRGNTRRAPSSSSAPNVADLSSFPSLS